MKKLLFSVAIVAASVSFGKTVKFSVNMTGVLKNVAGMHITGDFQSVAGFGLDWQAATTPMMQETADTNIYTILVNIPAFRKYEYKFVNGDQFYDAEFVPFPSRVLYMSDDNRWLYVDSLANDTTFVGAIMFGGNAPLGKRLLRVRVDMQNETLNPAGAHVAGSFQSWSPVNTYLYSFDTMMYEYLAYVDTNIINYQFKYINGNNSANYETVPVPCADGSGNRTIAVVTDTMLDVVCFSNCTLCSLVGVKQYSSANKITLSPNPMDNYSVIHFDDNLKTHTVYIYDVTGKRVRTYADYTGNTLEINKDNFDKGMYFIQATTKENYTAKLIVN